MKTILITNDDGIHSPGIEALRQAVSELGRGVIIAPDRDNSAISHALTMNRPLRVIQLDKDRYTVNGTPTDCVAVALKKILPNQPILLVSGINTGANVGDDISYSGTVSAAIEGTMYSVPSMAISVAGEPPYDFRSAVKIARCMARKIMQNSLPENTLLNINVPNGNSYKEIRVTRQGRRLWKNAIRETFDQGGNRHYWIGGGTPVPDPEEDTDVYAVANNCVSITPIQLDLTNHAGIQFLKEKWLLENGNDDNE